MKTGSILATIKKYLHIDEDGQETREGAVGQQNNGTKDALLVDLKDFEGRLNDIIEHFVTVSTGHVQLLDLDKIAKVLGDTYAKRKDVIERVVSRAIERHLAPDDVYTQYSDSSYVVVFARLDDKAAQLKTLLIADEIAEKLLGKSNEKNLVEVKTASVKEDGQVMFTAAPTVDLLMHQIRMAPSTVGGKKNPLKKALHEFDIVKDVQFIFHPMWHVKNKIVSTFMCVPVVCVAENTYTSAYASLSETTDAEIIENLDIATLNRACDELQAMHDKKKMALLAVPIHFVTLTHKKSRTKYIKVCATKLFDFKDKIVFEIVGLPEGVPDTRLFDFFVALHPFSRSVLARFCLDHKFFEGYQAAGIHSVGIDILDSQISEKEALDKMGKFVEAANKASLSTYIHGVRTRSLNMMAISAGFNYVNGYAIASTTDHVDGAYKFELHEIYKPA
jgi:EAL domain-containing protein (putative c-di-GMP-specific phosphodiesterase class I)